MATRDPLNRKRYFLAFSECGSEQREKTPFLQGKFGLTIMRPCRSPMTVESIGGNWPLIQARARARARPGQSAAAVWVDDPAAGFIFGRQAATGRLLVKSTTGRHGRIC